MRLRLASNGLVAKQEAHGAAALAFAHEQLSAKLVAKRAKLEAVKGAIDGTRRYAKGARHHKASANVRQQQHQQQQGQ